MKRVVFEFLVDKSAATSIEYAIIAAGVAVTIIVGVNAIGTGVLNTYTSVSSSIH